MASIHYLRARVLADIEGNLPGQPGCVEQSAVRIVQKDCPGCLHEAHEPRGVCIEKGGCVAIYYDRPAFVEGLVRFCFSGDVMAEKELTQVLGGSTRSENRQVGLRFTPTADAVCCFNVVDQRPEIGRAPREALIVVHVPAVP